MAAIKITDGVYDVGVTDWNIRDFHGYSTYLGTTYNAFLVVGEKVALLDTVKAPFAQQLIDNISEIIDPGRIDYFISNHTEMDHSGSIPTVMEAIGKEKPIYCSKMGHKNLPKHFREAFNYHPLANEESLSLGNKTLSFLETRMVHWPDSMFTYLVEDKVLFSSDGFGQHYAGHEKFDDQIDGAVIMPHAKKYFANILLLYAPMISKLIDRVTNLGLDIQTICPDHGIIWRKDPAKIIQAYARWSKQTLKAKAVVVYDTMWQSTEKMANAIAEAMAAEGVAVRPMKLRQWHRSDIMTEVLDAKAIVVGSPTLNNGLFPTVSDFLTYIKGLKPKQRIGAAFGSFGWSGEAVNLINQELETMKIDLVDPGLKVQYVPDKDQIEACRNFGSSIGQEVLSRLS
jgi:flavorubredoxin